MDNENDILIEKYEKCIIYTINRPNFLNAIGSSIINKLSFELPKWNSDESIQLVILKGSGEKAFSAGGDVKWFYQVLSDGKIEELKSFFKCEYTFDYRLSQKKPILISILDGYVMGGGVGLSIHSDIKIATERTIFAMPENRIGIVPDVGASYFFSKMGELGLYLGMTGDRLIAKEVVSAGIATHFIHSSNLKSLEEEIILFVKSEIPRDSVLNGIQNIIERYSEECHSNSGLIHNCKMYFSKTNFKEFWDFLIENFEDPFSKKSIELMEKCNPLSLRICFEMINSAKSLSMKECYELEGNLIMRLIEYPDFKEGIRAMIIDKDNSPNWKYKDVFDVPPQILEKIMKYGLSRMEYQIE